MLRFLEGSVTGVGVSRLVLNMYFGFFRADNCDEVVFGGSVSKKKNIQIL